MNENYFTNANTKCILVQLLFIITIQSVASAVYCPLNCICVFDEILEDNRANCTFGNSTVEMSWLRNDIYIILTIACTDPIENFHYNCNELPQFNITAEDGWLAMVSCAPSALKCAHLMYTPTSFIKEIDLKMLAGSYIAEELVHYIHVEQARIELRDNDTELPADAINSLTSMISLTVNGGNLQLSTKVFNQTNLEYLRLHMNNIHELPADTFNGLSNIRLLDIRDNSFEHLNANALRGLDSIENLFIENTTLTNMDPEAFSSNKRLNKLDLKYNRLKLVPNGLLTNLNSLYKVHIALNEVEMSLDTYAFANLAASVKTLDIHGSKVKHLPETLLSDSTNIQEIYFSNNQIESLPTKLFASMRNLKELELDRNRIQNLPEELFSEAKSLEIIKLAYNYISTLEGDIFIRNSKLKNINFDNNILSHIDRDVFKGTSLKRLSLASNKLKRISGNTTLDWQVKQLNLKFNELSVFEDWFLELVGLEDLDLSGNKITMIKESHIYRFNSKVTIDLRNNSITGIVRDTSDPFVNVTPGDVTLYLSNNPLQCDCVVTTLLKEWHKYGILADYEDITCDNEGKLSNLNAYVQCNKTHALVALIGSSAVGALVIIVILLTVFNQRRKIWINMRSFFKSKDLEVPIKHDTSFEMKEVIKQYDLFISFAHQDGDIVMDQLLPILEKDFELKVCVHYRDWIVGELIPVQIKESVESSKMTMIILTEHFLESQWSSLEFRTAHDLSIEDGKTRLILVLINESIIRHDKLQGDLKSYIEMNTYLLWHDIYFWDKLQKILIKNGQCNLKKKSFKR